MNVKKLITYCQLSKARTFKRIRSFCQATSTKYNVHSPVEKSSIPEKNEAEQVYSLLGDGMNYHQARLFRMNSKRNWKNKNLENDKEISHTMSDFPVSLKYVIGNVNNDLKEKYPDIFDKDYSGPDVIPEIIPDVIPETYSYPFSHHRKLITKNDTETLTDEKEPSHSDLVKKDYFANYLKILDVDVSNIDSYSSGRPEVPTSDIPCCGCGAMLHCQDISIPGFMPAIKFLSITSEELRKETCYRCFFLKYYNTAMNINISPDEYPQAISEIRKKNALVLLIVDLMDFPCSIWPGIINLIGETRPICVVGNKVDLLPRDSRGYLHRVKESLVQNLKDFGVDTGHNIKHVALVSAKTGYGVESLITKLQRAWKYKGDIYLVGCTNVGKSSLFNTLLQSDLCKKQASDIVPPTTTSVWPGTTVNLLKFPIFRMTDYEIYERTCRLIRQKKEDDAQKKAKFLELRETNDQKFATIFETVKKTYSADDQKNYEELFAAGPIPKSKSYNADDLEFKHGKFCYDTPGSIFKEQILDLLTTDELMKVLPKQIITPRTFQVREKQTLFVAGLGRIDLLKGGRHIFMTVFASHQLPIHLVDTVNANLFYEQNMGEEIIAVPQGGEKRLAEFPKLKGKNFSMTGRNWRESCADVVLSSVGWVSMTAGEGEDIQLIAYTPDARGIHLRTPAVLPLAVNLRGRRIKGVPAFDNKRASILL